MPREKIHFVTGRLARPALDRILPEVARQADFDFTVQTLPISVAALLTPAWIAPRIEIPPGTTRICLPGYCDLDLTPIHQVTPIPVLIGPRDLRQLPRFFGQSTDPIRLDQWDVEIVAEINHAPRWKLQDILDRAAILRRDGADLIDVGCDPQTTWTGVGDCVAALVDAGHRVSIDSFNPAEIEPAVAAGAELVLSVNRINREAAIDWGCEVVVIPDVIGELDSIEATMELLDRQGVRFRIDPILEPIGCGFAASLHRYHLARARWPDVEMLMGIGNLTELTDVDSAGINFLLLAICQELGIRSVLTTEVINWARSSVRECDLARRMVHYADAHQVPPKRLSDQLVMLRDPEVLEFSPDQIAQLAAEIKDHNYRILAEQNQIHLLGGGHHLAGTDPFELFDALMATQPGNVDPSHAFYLGYEMCKALTALQLGKQYTQDQALHWGHLTVDEQDRHRLRRRQRSPRDNPGGEG